MAFVTGSTPFGIFDADAAFQTDADRVLPYVLQKLGDPVMHVELTANQIYQSFEEACLEYSAIINQYQAKSVLTSLLGTPTGSLQGAENRYIQRNLEMERRMAEPYGDAAGVGDRPVYSGSITLEAGTQTYDLKALLSGTVNERITVKDVFHRNPLSAYRFFGTTSAINYLHNQFQFESFTPETVFYLLPIWEDVLRGMQFKQSANVRRSHYSYELHNNVLTIFPAPSQNTTLWFNYWKLPSATGSTDVSYYSASGSAVTGDPASYGVANLSNVPFGNIRYSLVNSIGKQWIWKLTLALAKEILGQVRSKMNTLPIPNGDVTLNGPELINDARQEADRLREELKGILEETTYDKLAAKEAEYSENLRRAIQDVPLGIFIG